MISSYLGYINMNVRLKNQVYTALGSIGDFYLLYVASRFFANGFWFRGLLFILAFLGLAYLAYLNVIYYLTKKNSRLDFTPWIEAKLHLQPRSEPKTVSRLRPGYVQTNGLFTNEQVLPAELVFSVAEKNSLNQIVKQLAAQNYLQLDYGGLSDSDILRAKKPGETVAILPEPIALPYFELQQRGKKLFLVGGVNQIEKKELGQIKTVGLMPAEQAAEKYQLFVAAAAIYGGPIKFTGRSSVMKEEKMFKLKVELAYRPK
nr:DUF6681 family protein [Liquorilactobacillus sicerae]